MDELSGFLKSRQRSTPEFFAWLEDHASELQQASSLIAAAINGGHKILVTGNGGSAAQAIHLSAEFVGRFQREREGLAAIALCGDIATLTSISNDYGYDQVFARQVSALGKKGDVLIAISTSGSSANITAAVSVATSLGIRVIALVGNVSTKATEAAYLALKVPSTETAIVQEHHLALLHLLCMQVESLVAS